MWVELMHERVLELGSKSFAHEILHSRCSLRLSGIYPDTEKVKVRHVKQTEFKIERHTDHVSCFLFIYWKILLITFLALWLLCYICDLLVTCNLYAAAWVVLLLG